MRRPSNRSRIEQLTDEWEPALKAAFLSAIADVVARADLGRIIERLERGDIAGAIEAVHLDPAAFRALDLGIAQAFDAGGASTIGALPILRDSSGGRFVVWWNVRNPRAEMWLREHSSTLITRIVEDQRFAIRSALERGLSDGRSPRSTALDLTGRVNRATGKREGGLLGLTGQQEQAVANARARLRSGDRGAMREYLSLGRRDKRFDRTVLRAISDGKTLDQATIDRIVGRYADGLLNLRGETIARTETMAALNQSSVEAMQQAVESGAVQTDAVTKVWHTAKDKRVRDSHAAQDRQSVGLNGVFSNGLRYPGDPSGGAAETANCRCWLETRVDFLAGIT